MAMSDLVELRHLNEEQQAVVDVIGIDNYRALMDEYGGSQLWIPKAKSLVPISEITHHIRCRRQNGDTLEQIARDLELPLADVRRLSKP